MPGLTETLALTLPGLAPPSGKRVFLTPNLLSRLPVPAASVGERQSDVSGSTTPSPSSTPFSLHLPASLQPEQLPAPVQLSTPFGTYSSQLLTLPDGTLRYVRRLEMPRTRFTAHRVPGLPGVPPQSELPPIKPSSYCSKPTPDRSRAASCQPPEMPVSASE